MNDMDRDRELNENKLLRLKDKLLVAEEASRYHTVSKT